MRLLHADRHVAQDSLGLQIFQGELRLRPLSPSAQRLRRLKLIWELDRFMLYRDRQVQT